MHSTARCAVWPQAASREQLTVPWHPSLVRSAAAKVRVSYCTSQYKAAALNGTCRIKFKRRTKEALGILEL